MANRLYNKQVSPKGYQTGGRVAKMGGGMMMKRPMMNKGGKALKPVNRKRKMTPEKLNKGAEEFFKKKNKDSAVQLKEGGKALKPVNPETQKGLSKLPTKVRNKMGFMKKGGKV